MPGHPSNGKIGRHALQHGAWRGHERPPSPRYDPNRRVEACPVITSHALISIMVGSKRLQAETGYIDARPYCQIDENLLHRVGGPYIWVRLGKARAEHNESTLPRAADIRADLEEVCVGPTRDLSTQQFYGLFNHPVGTGEKRRWQFKAKRLCCLERSELLVHTACRPDWNHPKSQRSA